MARLTAALSDIHADAFIDPPSPMGTRQRVQSIASAVLLCTLQITEPDFLLPPCRGRRDRVRRSVVKSTRHCCVTQGRIATQGQSRSKPIGGRQLWSEPFTTSICVCCEYF